MLDDPTNLREVIHNFQQETGCAIGENLIEKQRNLRKIIPAVLPREAASVDLINIELAL